MVVTNPNTDQARRSLTLIWPTPFCYRYAKPATVACWPTFWQVNNSVVSYFHLLEETEQTRRRLPSILNVRVKSAWNGAWHAAYDMSCTIYRKSKRRFPGGARCSACTRACVRFLILRTRCHRDRGFSSADVCVCVCVCVCQSLVIKRLVDRSPTTSNKAARPRPCRYYVNEFWRRCCAREDDRHGGDKSNEYSTDRWTNRRERQL